MRIDDIINREIELLGIRVSKSHYEKSNSSEMVMLQFSLDGERCVTFTGSTVLKEQAQKYQSELPFITTIRKIQKYYTMS